MAKTRKNKRGKSRKMRHLRRRIYSGGQTPNRKPNAYGSKGEPIYYENENNINNYPPRGRFFNQYMRPRTNSNSSSVKTEDPRNENQVNTSGKLSRVPSFLKPKLSPYQLAQKKAMASQPALPKPTLTRRAINAVAQPLGNLRNATRRGIGKVGNYVSDEIAAAKFRSQAKAEENKNRRAGKLYGKPAPQAPQPNRSQSENNRPSGSGAYGLLSLLGLPSSS